jgi:hypothetical protein
MDAAEGAAGESAVKQLAAIVIATSNRVPRLNRRNRRATESKFPAFPIRPISLDL